MAKKGFEKIEVQKDCIDSREVAYIAKQTVVDFYIRRQQAVEKRKESILIGIFAGMAFVSGLYGAYDAAIKGYDFSACILVGLLFTCVAAIGIVAGYSVYLLAAGFRVKDRDDYQEECFGEREVRRW